MDLTNEQWHGIRHHFSPPRHGRGRPALDSRRVLDGIFWKLRTAESWRTLPSHYPSHQTCHRFYHAWKSSGLLKELYIHLYEDLMYRGGFTPYQAVQEYRITFHILERSFKFYLAPRFQNDWRTNTALLLLQIEFRRTLKKLIAQISTGERQSRHITSLTLEFSKWPKFAPLLPGGKMVQTYAGPENIVFKLKQQKLYPAPSKKYPPLPEIRNSILEYEIFDLEELDT